MDSTRRSFLAAGCAVLAAGCFGKFAATNSLYDWNTEVSDNKWLRWLVFLVLAILPVYWIFIVADALVLNTIEFFSGNNPVGGGHVRRETEDGHVITSTQTEDPDVIRHEVEKDGEPVRVVYVRRDGEELWLLDEARNPLSRARRGADGEIELLGPEGQPLTMVTPSQQRRIVSAVQAGESVAQAAARELVQAPGVRMASRLGSAG